MAETIKATTEVTFKCAECGAELDANDTGGRYDDTTTEISVMPCAVCLDAAKDKAFEDGAASVEKES